MKYKILITALSGILVIAFQNCNSVVEFDSMSPIESTVEKVGQPEGIEGDTEGNDSVTNSSTDTTVDTESESGAGNTSTNILVEIEEESEAGEEYESSENNQNDNESNEESEESTGDQTGGYICILEGPGKSVRLGVIAEEALENGRTPDTVCMTENACDNIVSQKFIVKGPAKRGFCKEKGNPNVERLTEDQLQTLIDQVK